MRRRRTDGKGRDYVLVHGACHGAWCWEDLVPRLRRDGHRAVTLDLPGHGHRAHERHRASIAGYAQAVADAMALAGAVIPKVAELVRDRIAHLVFLAALVVPHGASIADTHMPPAGRTLIQALARASGVDCFLYPAVVAWSRYYNDVPAGDSRVVAALARLTPEPIVPWFERIDLARFYALDVPWTYVRCLRGVAVPRPRRRSTPAVSASRPSTSTARTRPC